MVDREAFGHWLSGFTDGEGCFTLSCGGNITGCPRAEFLINLRADDVGILTEIREYFQCGEIRSVRQTGRLNPCMMYRVRKAGDLLFKIVPHFESFPLRAKKRHDFEVWKEGVKIIYDTMRRPGSSRRIRRTINDYGEFGCLVELLKMGRVYKCINSNVE